MRRWLDQRTDAALFAASVGNAPSIADVVKMIHPKPATPEREALYRYLIGRDVMLESLPALVRQFEAFKAGDRAEVPDVPFQMLTAIGLNRGEWAQVARRGSWQMVRMNLNTFARHGVFDEPGMTDLVARRLSAPLAQLNRRRARGELVVVVSDNESWIDANGARGTATMREWGAFRARNPRARLVLIDLQPYATTQAIDREDILNIGGFSDHVFELVSQFAAGRLNGDHWVGQIESVAI